MNKPQCNSLRVLLSISLFLCLSLSAVYADSKTDTDKAQAEPLPLEMIKEFTDAFASIKMTMSNRLMIKLF